MESFSHRKLWWKSFGSVLSIVLWLTLQVLEPRAFYPIPLASRDVLFQQHPPCPVLSQFSAAVSNGSLGVHWWRHATESSNQDVFILPQSVLGHLGKLICPAALAAQGSSPVLQNLNHTSLYSSDILVGHYSQDSEKATLRPGPSMPRLQRTDNCWPCVEWKTAFLKSNQGSDANSTYMLSISSMLSYSGREYNWSKMRTAHHDPCRHLFSSLFKNL